MGDVGIESTLVLDGLAVSKVRFYSTLDSDVGKRVEITDKFNPSNVFTGTFDASLNLLYDLPAFTSYRVKMYGLDGETVESDQSFMLKGYDYLEKNVGLNKNSFAGIKAIVDQGLEDSMIEIGHEFTEDDERGDSSCTWIVVAKNLDKYFNHSVYIARKRPLRGDGVNAVATRSLETFLDAYNAYYNGLPSSIKNAITERHLLSSFSLNQNPDPTLIANDAHVWYPSWVELNGNTIVNFSVGNNKWNGRPTNTEVGELHQFPYYLSHMIKTFSEDEQNYAMRTRSTLVASGMGYNGVIFPQTYEQNNVSGIKVNNANTVQYTDVTTTVHSGIFPHMMIASDPI